MDNLTIIISHCDTPDKINLLKKQIKRLKDLNIDTLLYSHIALEVSIQQAVTYYIYDTDNPVIYWPERSLHLWLEYGKKDEDSVRLEAMFPDHGWTVLDQIKKASTFALPLKYNYYSFINYDILLTPELEFFLVSPSDTPHSVIVDPGVDIDQVTHRNGGRGLIFTVIRQDVLEKINARINKSDYLKAMGDERFSVSAIAETYWGQLLSPYDCFVLPDGVEASIRTLSGNQNRFNDNFKVFFQNGNMPDEPHLTKAFFYNIKDNTSIKIQCNDQSYLIEKTSTIDLPTNVTKLGFFDNGAYCDFLPEFDEAKLRHHCIVPLDTTSRLETPASYLGRVDPRVKRKNLILPYSLDLIFLF
jgi:hypothetical protein